MANSYGIDTYQEKTNILDSVTLPNAATTIEGGKVLWKIGTALTASRDFTVRNYDSSRTSEYLPAKPVVMIKCAVDASSNNAVIKNAAGDTLFTFSANNSVTPAYLVLKLTAAGAWEVA